jgi:hypothetical protein
MIPLKKPSGKTKIFWTLMKVKVLSHFEYHLTRRMEAEDSELLNNELIELVVRDIGLEYIPK